MKDSENNGMLRLVLRVWRVFACIGLVVSVLLALIAAGFWISGAVNGWIFDDDPLFMTILPESGPSLTYRMLYAALFRMFAAAVMNAAAFVFDLRYLKPAIAENTWFPGGKKQGLLFVLVFHGIAAMAAVILVS